ncbi:hypothetical protein BDP27DRAFT_1318900 [Rhodocollybia butyracea]|uniref:ABM domain-containing protein n=1 Tax=Rhodocollybia butyracea TaxID=206335 RepID=A0A9P5Q1Q3_9AGAR|nr:hypothetical protein BDP27DRAFT_1318900 [Rhodocollybia butyracea]
MALSVDEQIKLDLEQGPNEIPQTTSSGKIIVIATIHVTPGNEARMIELLRQNQASSLSDKEPNTLTYRVTRVLKSDGTPTSSFLLIEEYNGPVAGFKEHIAQAPTFAMLKAYKEEGFLAKDIDIEFCDEIPPRL